MSSNLALQPRATSYKAQRRSATLLRSTKEALDDAARESKMSTSSYLEMLLIARFGRRVPRLVLSSTRKDGTRIEIPLGSYTRQREWLATEDEDVLRPSFSFSPEYNKVLGDAAAASGMNFSAYIRRVLEMGWPNGFPALTAEISTEDSDELSQDSSLRLEFVMD